MDDLIASIKQRYPELKFCLSDSFYWSPETAEIFYNDKYEGDLPKWSVLHEVGHALCGHKSYDADYMLIRLEVEAWQKAREISKHFSIDIDESHIQDCLDTYRDWIYKRSICPECSTKCFQQSDFSRYKCFNCHASWHVTPSRFCRAYRVSEKLENSQKVFV